MAKDDSSSQVILLNSILQKVVGMANQLDTKISILVAISSAIFLFSVSSANGHIYIIILGVFSGLSTIAALAALQPPNFLRKTGQKESLLYQRKIATFSSSDEYEKALRSVDGKAMQEYAREVYNISKFYYLPKRRFFESSRFLLLVGFIVSFCVFLLELL